MRHCAVMFLVAVSTFLVSIVLAQEADSSETCSQPPVPRVAVFVPCNPKMNYELKNIMMTNLRKMVESNPKLSLRVFIDSGPIEVLPDDERPLSKAARLRNRMLDTVDLSEYDYVLWLDADVVEYPMEMPTRLIQDNPDGVTAPLVLIEEPGPAGPNQFYDTTAFTLKGRANHKLNETTPYVEGRSVQFFRPWVPGVPDEQEVVEMDGVGTIYMMPTRLFIEGKARFEDHRCLTEHWSVVKRAHDMGMKVAMHRGIVTRHANLPKYGESWHNNTK